MMKQATRSRQKALRPTRCVEKKWRRTGAALLVFGGLTAPAHAAESGSGMGLRNLTSAAITEVHVSPAGQNAFGPDQVALIPGRAVDQNNVLPLTDITPGRSDLRITDAIGRVCWVRDIALEPDKVIPLHNNDLTDCDP